MTTPERNGTTHSLPLDGLGGVSLAELEYAFRYADHLALGERRPDASGFDRERVKLIEQTVDGRWHAYKRRLNRRAR